MQYLLLIHGDAQSTPSAPEWDAFFARAIASGTFQGGSALDRKQLIGTAASPIPSDHLTGFMRFDAADRQVILDLLTHHPVILHGGTVELCEMPQGTAGDQRVES